LQPSAPTPDTTPPPVAREVEVDARQRAHAPLRASRPGLAQRVREDRPDVRRDTALASPPAAPTPPMHFPQETPLAPLQASPDTSPEIDAASATLSYLIEAADEARVDQPEEASAGGATSPPAGLPAGMAERVHVETGHVPPSPQAPAARAAPASAPSQGYSQGYERAGSSGGTGGEQSPTSQAREGADSPAAAADSGVAPPTDGTV